MSNDRRRVAFKILTGPVATVVAVTVMILLYAHVVAVRPPSSQAAALAVVIDGLDPESGAGLRVDLVARVNTSTVGCGDQVPVHAVISGTPEFWRRYSDDLMGRHRVGVGLRTSYSNPRLLDFSGYNLPEELGNLWSDGRIPHPHRSGYVDIEQGQDSSTGADWYTAVVRDWGTHRTPLVLELDARWTSRRGLGSCYVVLPELTAVDGPAVGDAHAAAVGASSVFEKDLGSPIPNAITFGRVVLRTDGHLSEGDSRPAPSFVDGNPWASELGLVGEEAGVWACEPPPSRDAFPRDGATSPDGSESVPDVSSAAHQGCGGLAVAEARAAGTARDLSLLVIGGLFGFLFQRLINLAATAVRRLESSTEAAV